MSYSATISFKKINSEDLYDFFINLKSKVSKNLDKVAKSEYIFSPYAKNNGCFKEDTLGFKTGEALREWALKVFSYRYFYNKDLNLLGIYGVPTCIEDLFDCTIHFQNSCDQDYEFEEWKSIPEFKAIAEKWKNATDEEVFQHFEYPGEHTGKVDYDYYRRTFAYDEIWKIIEHTLYREETIVYLGLFGRYDLEPSRFSELVKREYDEWVESIKKAQEKSKEKSQE